MDRTAVATIAGYIFQFDCSIAALLRLASPTDGVDIERIEDFDIRTSDETTAVQCKYYEATEYNHSVIAPAIRLMVTDYSVRSSEGKGLIRYKLFAHFGHGIERAPARFSVSFLKDHILTYSRKRVQHRTHEELSLSDSQLNEFIGLCAINLHAPTIETQRRQILKQLRVQFHCDEFEAEHFFYNNALATIARVASTLSPEQRRLTRQDFISRIDHKTILFNTWLIKFHGRDRWLRDIRKRYFALPLNSQPHERFFLLDCQDNPAPAAVVSLLRVLQHKWSKLSKREPQSFCPYVYLHAYPRQKLAAIKVQLRSDGIRCVDGYDFMDAEFFPQSILHQATAANGVKLKFLNTEADLGLTIAQASGAVDVFQLYLNRPFFSPPNENMPHHSIQVESIDEIMELVK